MKGKLLNLLQDYLKGYLLRVVTLGPLLWNVYINDLHLVPNARVFVNDVTVSATVKSGEEEATRYQLNAILCRLAASGGEMVSQVCRVKNTVLAGLQTTARPPGFSSTLRERDDAPEGGRGAGCHIRLRAHLLHPH